MATYASVLRAAMRRVYGYELILEQHNTLTTGYAYNRGDRLLVRLGLRPQHANAPVDISN